ncbi:hypothetical protein AAMO2058_000518100 [Amorphochlora amoebiformis]
MVGFLQSLGSRVCHPLPHQQFRVSNTTTITTDAPRALWDVKHELLLEQSCERLFCLLNKTTALQVNPTTARRSTQRPPDNTAEENIDIAHSLSESDNARVRRGRGDSRIHKRSLSMESCLQNCLVVFGGYMLSYGLGRLLWLHCFDLKS